MKNLINKNSTLFVMLLLIIVILLVGGYVWYTRSLCCAGKPADTTQPVPPTNDTSANDEGAQD